MKISSDNLLKEAFKLKEATKSSSNKNDDKKTGKATEFVENKLGQLQSSLKMHQKNLLRYRLEETGLKKINNSLTSLKNDNKVDADSTNKTIKAIISATKFRQEQVISPDLQQIITTNLSNKDNLNSTTDEVSKRLTNLEKLVNDEFKQISKIEVSFQNIVSANIPSSDKARVTLADIKNELAIQDQIKTTVDPATVMHLLKA